MLLLSDFQTSVKRAFSEIDPQWPEYKGLVVCGSHSPENAKKIIQEIEIARVKGIPFLGICWGHQLAAIEYARNVLGIMDATSEEYGKGTFIVRKRPELKVGLHEGVSWWSNYEVDPEFEAKWEKPEHFITVAFHPEYQSSKTNPHPILVQFLELCKK